MNEKYCKRTSCTLIELLLARHPTSPPTLEERRRTHLCFAWFSTRRRTILSRFTLIESLFVIPIIATAFFAAAALQGGEMKLLSLYSARYSKESPKITGTLDDACWKKATVYNTYYVYYKPNPGPGKLKTTFRMLWNEKGVYLGITNYDDKIGKIRKVNTTRDSGKLWTDDCAELYFDPTGDGVGFTKITVNPLGTIADMRQIDAAVKLPSWSASGLDVKTSQNEKAWIIELFVPWSDLGAPAQPGAIWKFCHVRYAWSSGKFVGVTSSPGGNYNNPGNFGFLYFAKGADVNIDKIGEILRKKAAPPWCIPMGESLLVSEKGKLTCEKLKTIFEKKQVVAKKQIRRISAIINPGMQRKTPTKSESTEKKNNLEKLKKYEDKLNNFQKVANPTFEEIRKLNKLNDELDEFKWNLKLNKLMAD